MTSRGLVEKDFMQIAEYLHQAMAICLDILKQRYMYFIVDLENNKDIKELRAEDQKFAISFETSEIVLVLQV
jgi:glycine hydroxymethyltransferase